MVQNIKTKRFLKRFVLALVLILSIQIPAFANNYKNIEGHWAKDNIIKAIDIGIISNDDSINPDANITRIEYIKLVNKAFDLKPIKSKSNSSTDSMSNWYDSDVNIAREYGYIENVFDESFLQQDKEITRQEAAIILNQVMSIKEAVKNIKSKGEILDEDVLKIVKNASLQKEIDLSNNISQRGIGFTDAHEINKNFLNAVKSLTDDKVISGYSDGSFKPNKALKKSEAIYIILKATDRAVEVEPAKVTVKVENKETSTTEVPNIDANPNLRLELSEGKFYIVNSENNERVKKSDFVNGVVKTLNNTYLIKDDGEVTSGFIKENGKTYYANGEKGLIRGWKEIDGSLYYFSPMDNRMYVDGVYSTGEKVHWFGKDGKIKTGSRPAGYKGKKSINWKYPTREELTNSWLQGENQELRFRGQEIANYAAKHEGIPFKWHGCDLKDKSGIYCCGAVYSAYKAFGIHVPGPDDCNMYGERGYEMVRVQHTQAEKFGGEYLPADYSKLYPGDLSYYYSPKLKNGYNHAAIFMGYNGDTPLIIHATLANGFVMEDAYICTNGWGYKNLKFVRYNTDKNKGIGNVVPE